MDKVAYFDNPMEPQYVQLGFNWRMSSITAALGISQLNKLDKIIKMRQENARFLSSRLSTHVQITVPSPPAGYEHIYQMYTVRLPDQKTRDDLHQYLTKKRIFSKVYFNPIHLTSFYREKFKTNVNDLPVTERVYREILTIPVYPNMTSEEKEYLVQSISEFFEGR